MVRSMGLEPIRLLTHAPQTCLSAYSSTTASNSNIIALTDTIVNSIFHIFKNKKTSVISKISKNKNTD